jgi:hypothetical protein
MFVGICKFTLQILVLRLHNILRISALYCFVSSLIFVSEMAPGLHFTGLIPGTGEGT